MNFCHCHTLQEANLPQMNLQIQWRIFSDKLNNLVLGNIWKTEGLHLAKSNMKKNKEEEFVLLCIMIIYKTMVNKNDTVVIVIDQQKRSESEP